MENLPIRSITIVGGGSSGWMTATFLNRLYNQQRKNVHIRLIESEDVGIIGVGEATVHSIRFFFAAMGISETELIAQTNATLKTGILFRNWMKPDAGNIHEYLHPFDNANIGGSLDAASAWLGLEGDKPGFDKSVSLAHLLIPEGKCPKTSFSRDYQGLMPYAYHFDATLMARFLRKKACEAGVEHIVANVTGVIVEGEQIVAIDTDNGRFDSDIYIDCTGFRGLLISKLKDDNWISFEKELPCNKAVAIQREYSEGQSPKPYTTATALSNGWVWEIDLCHRQGTGYVYDGNRLTREQAEEELREHLGDKQAIVKVTHIDMKIGRRKEAFIGNCVAIGLSGGFIEPLESTGLHLINLAVRLLATHLPGRQISQPVRNAFNQKVASLYEDLKQFIVLHYCLTDRRDSEFWCEASKSADYLPELKEKLALWQMKVCEDTDLGTRFNSIFTEDNYRYVLYGMKHSGTLSPSLSQVEIEEHLRVIKLRNQQIAAQAMSHKQFLKL